MIRSIFNDVVGPVMRGPSSSHTAASVRIGHLARKLLGEEPVKAVFRFDPNGSLVTTYRGQGSAMGLAGGLLGLEVTDPNLYRSEELVKEKGLQIKYVVERYGATHPNTYLTEVTAASGRSVKFTALSTGGGIIKLTELNGEKISDDSDYINDLMPVAVDRNANQSFGELDYTYQWVLERQNSNLSDIGREYESIVGSFREEQVSIMAGNIVQIMNEAIKNGISGTSYEDRILQQQSHLIGEASKKNILLPAGVTNDIIESVSAIMETKSSMGVIVAAPTAGACATLGGTIIPMAKLMGKKEEDLANAILAAGLIGVLIDLGAGFSAEEGGCQYETGSAAGMTAAALVDLAGGNAETGMSAASMALQNTLGLICDPVADRVEVPCLGKNIVAGVNALASANMALAGYQAVIPLDEVIHSMREVAGSMHHNYRCTCKGGLSISKTAQRIHKELNSK